MAIKLCSLYVALIFCFFNQAICLQNETDKLALISLKNAIQHDPLNVFSSWNESFPFCDWYGVQCGQRHPDRVVALNLESLGLVGTLSPHIGNLSFLRYLSFRNNSFHGKIPQEIGGLRRLQYVRLTNNSFGGNIPTNLSRCSNLELIALDGNKLVGSIPVELGSLLKLGYLDLARNNLTGSIPLSIGNLSSLKELNFTRNDLQGQIPKEMSQLQRLTLMSLAENHLSGEIPIGLYNISNLEVFEARENQLNGSIPSNIGILLPKLRSLLFEFNMFNGKIPHLLSNAFALEQIALGSNTLTGPIPSEVGSLQNLVQLDLSNNRLSGMIPNTIGKCSSLEKLHLEGNSLGGEIPQVLRALQNLLELDLSRNNFSGRIPNSLAKLDGLKYLNLSFNQLQGEVPKRGVFLNSSVVSLSGNNSFCGGITEFKLPSCPSPNSKKKKNFLPALEVIIQVFFLIFFIVVNAWSAFFLLSLRQKRKSRKKNISIPALGHHFLRISFAELLKATDGFSRTNIIGVGSYGSVYKGTLEQEGIQVAVKVLNMQQKGVTSSFMSECEALRRIRHLNLLKLLSVCSSIDFEGNDFKALIYEFMVNGSLEKWLHAGEHIEQRELRNLKLKHRLNISIDIATAVEYLHSGSSSTIIHGDLKPSNVLLDDEMTTHIGDFGLARILSSVSGEIQLSESTSRAFKGSIGYVAPEYGIGHTASIEGDVYSYGILLLEMFTGKKPNDKSFKDDLNLHTFVKTSLPHRVMDIVDQRIMFEDEEVSINDYIISALRIGVACSMEQPGERMEMRDEISELKKIIDSYEKKKRFKQGRRNVYQIGVQSSSRM